MRWKPGPAVQCLCSATSRAVPCPSALTCAQAAPRPPFWDEAHILLPHYSHHILRPRAWEQSLPKSEGQGKPPSPASTVLCDTRPNSRDQDNRCLTGPESHSFFSQKLCITSVMCEALVLGENHHFSCPRGAHSSLEKRHYMNKYTNLKLQLSQVPKRRG